MCESETVMQMCFVLFFNVHYALNNREFIIQRMLNILGDREERRGPQEEGIEGGGGFLN